MPIKRSGNIEKYVEQRMQLLQSGVIQAMHNVGLECVTIARTMHRYTDQTGNLTSSMGYYLIQDGMIISKSNFDIVKQGSEGAKEGEQLATKIMQEHPQGIYLIVVAGMPYAKYVEARGYDVLDSAEMYAQREVINKVRDAINILTQ